MPILFAILGGFKRLFDIIVGLLSKLSLQGIVGLVAAVVLGFGWLHSAGQARHFRKDAVQWEKKFRAEKVQFANLVAGYRLAQATAHANNVAEVARIDTASDTITNEVRHGYESDLARLRADNQRLRNHSANQGAAGQAGVSVTAESASAAGQDLCVPSDQLLRAQELELKANAWSDWYQRLVAAWPKH